MGVTILMKDFLNYKWSKKCFKNIFDKNDYLEVKNITLMNLRNIIVFDYLDCFPAF